MIFQNLFCKHGYYEVMNKREKLLLAQIKWINSLEHSWLARFVPAIRSRHRNLALPAHKTVFFLPQLSRQKANAELLPQLGELPLELDSLWGNILAQMIMHSHRRLKLCTQQSPVHEKKTLPKNKKSQQDHSQNSSSVQKNHRPVQIIVPTHFSRWMSVELNWFRFVARIYRLCWKEFDPEEGANQISCRACASTTSPRLAEASSASSCRIVSVEKSIRWLARSICVCSRCRSFNCPQVSPIGVVMNQEQETEPQTRTYMRGNQISQLTFQTQRLLKPGIELKSQKIYSKKKSTQLVEDGLPLGDNTSIFIF